MKLLTRKYNVKGKCINCGSTTELKVPKGTWVFEFLEQTDCRCNFCGCRVTECAEFDISPSVVKEKLNRRLITKERELLELENDN